MQTKSASFTETTGFVKLTGCSDNLLHTHVDVGGALIDDGTLRYRINAVKEDSEYYREFFDGTPFDVERKIGALALEWDVTPDTRISFNIDDLNDDRPQNLGLLGTEDGIVTLPEDTIILNQPRSHYLSDVRNHNIDIVHYFNQNWSIKTGYSFQNYERDRYDNQLRARRRVNRWDFENVYLDVSGDY